MKIYKIIFTKILILTICCSFVVFAQKVVQRATIPDQQLNRIVFADSLHGIISAYRGVVYLTSDGGVTWNSSIVTLENIICDYVAMLDSMTAYVLCTLPSSLYRTTNGGVSWDSLGKLGQTSLYTISFYNSQLGFLSSDSGLMRTTDGGSSWKMKETPSGKAITAITFYDSLHVAAAGMEGYVIYSEDGGVTWLERSLPHQITPNAICFAGRDNLVVGAYAMAPDFLSIWFSSNRGDTWRTSENRESVFSLSSIDSSVVLSQNNEADIIISYDKGESWQKAYNLSQTDSIFYPYDIRIMPSGKIYVLDYYIDYLNEISRIYEISKNPVFTATNLTPLDNSQNVVLSPNPKYPSSIMFQWRQAEEDLRLHSVIQLSTDSTFNSESTKQLSVVNSDYSTHAYSVAIPFLSARTQYFWRVTSQYIDGTISSWSPIFSLTTAGGIIKGLVYEDLDKDGHFTSEESGRIGQQVRIIGPLNGVILSDSLGIFNLVGIDSGNYTIQCNLFGSWRASTPTEVHVRVELNDSISGIEFGQYYPWSTVSGKVYYDVNENGRLDSTETGMNGWSLTLHSNLYDSIAQTSGEGEFTFGHLENLACSVYVNSPVGWEKITPRLIDGYSFEHIGLNQHYININFGVHPIPSRVKTKLYYHDSTSGLIQRLSFGTREGAVFGLWDADTAATDIDFSEGESELPHQYPEIFDARFISPRTTSAQFGAGSWVDIRPYFASTQIDTYKVQFTTGVAANGSYPVTFWWSKEQISNSYDGTVLMRIPAEVDKDMKLLDSVVIRDPELHSLVIIASSPILSPVGIHEDIEYEPRVLNLWQNYPNPFNPTTTLSFVIGNSSLVTLKVYDVLGREVAHVFNNERMEPGSHEVVFNAGNLPSGVYYYRIVAGSYVSTKQMMVIK